MAGTEETQEVADATVDSDSSIDSDRRAWLEARGPVDDSIRALTLSELHNRVLVGRTWRAQGMVEGEPLDIVREACKEFLADTTEESLQLAGKPYVPPREPCADCKGVDMHKPTCVQLRR